MKTRHHRRNTMRVRTVGYGYGDSVVSAVQRTLRTLQASLVNVTAPQNRRPQPVLAAGVPTECVGALSFNGHLENGEELFCNTCVVALYRGTASLATWGANADGVINANDPLFNNLLVWKDQNGDGKQQAAEVSSLSTLGISSLDCNTGTFTQGGLTKQMSTLTLNAETVGSSYVPKGDGIQINTNNGQQTLLVTQVHDLNALLPNADGFTTDQNVPAIIATRGNGTTTQGLLDNDHVSNAPNAKQSNHYKSRSCLRPIYWAVALKHT